MNKNNNMMAALLLLFAMLATPTAWAHAPDQSYVFLTVDEKALLGHVDVTIADINDALGIALSTDHSVTMSDLQPHSANIIEYIQEHVKVSVNGSDMQMPYTELSLFDIPLAQYIQLHFAFTGLTEAPNNIEVEHSILFDQRSSHRGMTIIENNWKTGTYNDEGNVVLVFKPGDKKQAIDLSNTSKWTGFMAMIRLGVHHIWEGIDHILFLLALLLPAVVVRQPRKWQPVENFRTALIHVVKIVTVFTVAHTITLSLASLDAISLSSRLVESIIALSIAVAALDILIPIFKRRIWAIVFIFGLFHGFGFASVLGEYGISSSYIIPSLLGFNLGVELGQLAIVLVLFPVLYMLRNFKLYTRLILPLGALLLIAISLYWFIERGFEVDLPAGAIVNHVLAWFK